MLSVTMLGPLTRIVRDRPGAAVDQIGAFVPAAEQIVADIQSGLRGECAERPGIGQITGKDRVFDRHVGGLDQQAIRQVGAVGGNRVEAAVDLDAVQRHAGSRNRDAADDVALGDARGMTIHARIGAFYGDVLIDVHMLVVDAGRNLDGVARMRRIDRRLDRHARQDDEVAIGSFDQGMVRGRQRLSQRLRIGQVGKEELESRAVGAERIVRERMHRCRGMTAEGTAPRSVVADLSCA